MIFYDSKERIYIYLYSLFSSWTRNCFKNIVMTAILDLI